MLTLFDFISISQRYGSCFSIFLRFSWLSFPASLFFQFPSMFTQQIVTHVSQLLEPTSMVKKIWNPLLHFSTMHMSLFLNKSVQILASHSHERNNLPPSLLNICKNTTLQTTQYTLAQVGYF